MNDFELLKTLKLFSSQLDILDKYMSKMAQNAKERSQKEAKKAA
jgi:hypothetical protein